MSDASFIVAICKRRKKDFYSCLTCHSRKNTCGTDSITMEDIQVSALILVLLVKYPAILKDMYKK